MMVSLKSFVACTLLTVSSAITFAHTASAETPLEVITDSSGNTWQIELDSRYTYINSNGVRQVDFKLSTTDDDYWHEATASCRPYDIKSNYYGWDWSDTRSYAAGTVGGNIARAACDW